MATRSLYDKETVEEAVKSAEKASDYMLYSGKYYNDRRCMISRGVIGGTTTSISNKNLVDLESDLRGQTRKLGRCNASRYQPKCESYMQDPHSGLPCPSSDKGLVPVPSCSMITFKPVIKSAYGRY